MEELKAIAGTRADYERRLGRAITDAEWARALARKGRRAARPWCCGGNDQGTHHTQDCDDQPGAAF